MTPFINNLINTFMKQPHWLQLLVIIVSAYLILKLFGGKGCFIVIIIVIAVGLFTVFWLMATSSLSGQSINHLFQTIYLSNL